MRTANEIYEVVDNGYATADTRAEFSEEEIKLTYPVRKQGRKGYYHKYEFDIIGLENMEVTCSAGNTTEPRIKHTTAKIIKVEG